jgi:predicted RNA-binding Zn-ribbon protein involved in translation (DUF1610 family)
MYFTGQTKTEWGKLLKLYQCPSGHKYWLNLQQDQYNNDNSNSSGSNNNQNNNAFAQLKCPICGSTVYFTGKTITEYGHLLKIYRCPSGHESVGN